MSFDDKRRPVAEFMRESIDSYSSNEYTAG